MHALELRANAFHTVEGSTARRFFAEHGRAKTSTLLTSSFFRHYTTYQTTVTVWMWKKQRRYSEKGTKQGYPRSTPLFFVILDHIVAPLIKSWANEPGIQTRRAQKIQLIQSHFRRRHLTFWIFAQSCHEDAPRPDYCDSPTRLATTPNEDEDLVQPQEKSKQKQQQHPGKEHRRLAKGWTHRIFVTDHHYQSANADGISSSYQMRMGHILLPSARPHEYPPLTKGKAQTLRRHG